MKTEGVKKNNTQPQVRRRRSIWWHVVVGVLLYSSRAADLWNNNVVQLSLAGSNSVLYRGVAFLCVRHRAGHLYGVRVTATLGSSIQERKKPLLRRW